MLIFYDILPEMNNSRLSRILLPSLGKKCIAQLHPLLKSTQGGMEVHTMDSKSPGEDYRSQPNGLPNPPPWTLEAPAQTLEVNLMDCRTPYCGPPKSRRGPKRSTVWTSKVRLRICEVHTHEYQTSPHALQRPMEWISGVQR